MLIPKLVDYARSQPGLLDDPLFEEKPIRWQLDIKDGGIPVGGLQLLGEKTGLPSRVPKKVGGNAGGVATFATDNARFVLGLAETPADSSKAERDIAAFRRLLDLAADSDPANAGFAAVKAFYSDPARIAHARAEAAEKKVKPADRVALAYFDDGGIRLHETEAGRAFWRNLRLTQDAERTPAGAVACLSCGQTAPPVNTNDTKIMGVPDGQPSGTALVSFDKDAFQSHGWDKNLNAPVCESCSQAYTRGLNHLLRRDSIPRTRVDEGGAAFVIWSDAGTIAVLDALIDPNSDEAEQAFAAREGSVAGQQAGVSVLRAPRNAALPPEAPKGRVYALGLRGNGGRAVVTDWFDTSISEAYDNLSLWFSDLEIQLIWDEKFKGEIVRKAGQRSRRVPAGILARATARDYDGISGRVLPALIRAALRAEPLPITMAGDCVHRLKLDGFGDYFAPARVGLIRCTLNRLPQLEGRKFMPGLDPDNQDSAYLCGRLLATLEAVQYAAVGDVGATIIDRFYGRASTSPALVFGQLMSLAQSHLGGIDNAGAKRNLERDLEEVMAGLTAFPKTLFIEDQGSFALGYWHQRAKRFEDLRQRRNARQSAEAESQPGTESEGELL